MGFFDSEIIQQEAMKLFQDYQSLMQLGGDYGKFDREGKKLFIEHELDSSLLISTITLLRMKYLLKTTEKP